MKNMLDGANPLGLTWYHPYLSNTIGLRFAFETRKLPWSSFAEQRPYYTCHHAFVIVGRICFNVVIFLLVIVLAVKIDIFNFCLALLTKYLIWSLLHVYQHCETIRRCLQIIQLRATLGMKVFAYVKQSHLIFQLKPDFSCCLIVERHYTIQNEKRGNKFSFLMDAIFSETKF